MRPLCALAALAIASGCASSKPLYLPDGRQGHSIKCDGAALNWGLCYEKASELCQARGYDIVSKEGQESITGTPVFVGSQVTRLLVIACK
jgi:hypothetical protein